MAQRVQESIIGVDVSKKTLDVYMLASEETCSINNEVKSIERWLDGSAGRLCVAIEPTNSYHIAFAQAAHSRGHQVYLIDPYRLAHYREGVGQRVKTDTDRTAENIIVGLENDEADIFPDEMRRQMFDVWKSDYRGLERMVYDMHHAA